MKQKSRKQRMIDHELANIKKTMRKQCAICGLPANDLSHILPRSLYPEYAVDPRNLQILCRDCHTKFDNDREFRREQIDIVAQAKEIDELATNRYFGL